MKYFQRQSIAVLAFLSALLFLNSGCGSSSNPTTSTTPSIVVTSPASGQVIVGGSPNFMINWSGTGIASQKTIDYSLDNGVTWTTIGSMNADVTYYSWNVPNVASTKAIVRITDANGLKGLSGTFSISLTQTLAVGEMDATVGGVVFKSLNGKALNGSLTVTVKASIKKQNNANLDSVSITMIIGKQGTIPYTIDLSNDATSSINFCIVNPASGTCSKSYAAKKSIGSGSITITANTPIIEGVFSGTLPEVGGSGSLTITNGTFKAQLN